MRADLFSRERRKLGKILEASNVAPLHAGSGIFLLVKRNVIERRIKELLKFRPLKLTQLFVRPPLALIEKPAVPAIGPSFQPVIGREKN